MIVVFTTITVDLHPILFCNPIRINFVGLCQNAVFVLRQKNTLLNNGLILIYAKGVANRRRVSHK